MQNELFSSPLHVYIYIDILERVREEGGRERKGLNKGNANAYQIILIVSTQFIALDIEVYNNKSQTWRIYIQVIKRR